MKIIYPFIISLLLLGCNEKPKKSSILSDLEQNIWMDSLCNEYHFKDYIISKKLLYEVDTMRDTIGKINYDDAIVLEFDVYEDDSIIERYSLKHQRNGKLEFKTSDTLFRDFMVLFKKDSIKKPKVDLLELSLKVTPSFLYSGVLELTLSRDKKIFFIKDLMNPKLEKTTFSDTTFHQIEKYIEILEFNKYMDRYEYPGFDGNRLELKIKTNQYTKEIVSIQRAPEGLRNLISFIDYKLQIEKGLSLH